MRHWSRKLKAIGACEEAVVWAATQPDFHTAWQACERAHWLLWLTGNMADKPGWPERKTVILAGIACGRLSLKHAGKWRKELEEVFDVAERCANHPTPENVSAARSAESAAWSADSAAWSAAHKTMCGIIRERITPGEL